MITYIILNVLGAILFITACSINIYELIKGVKRNKTNKNQQGEK